MGIYILSEHMCALVHIGWDSSWQNVPMKQKAPLLRAWRERLRYLSQRRPDLSLPPGYQRWLGRDSTFLNSKVGGVSISHQVSLRSSSFPGDQKESQPSLEAIVIPSPCGVPPFPVPREIRMNIPHIPIMCLIFLLSPLVYQ